jgi:thiol-disulfide isomerase/thioredoxin
MKNIALCVVVAALVPCSIAHAQKSKDKPAPAAAPARDAKAEELLQRIRDAWKETRTLSYTGVVTGDEGAGAQPAKIVCQRADAGGWKVAVHISDDPDAALAAAGYDGVTARVVKPKDRVVVERSADTLEDLRVFLAGQGLRHVIAWDVLEDTPFSDGVSYALAKPETVEGVACDVLEVTLRDDRAVTTPDDMEKGKKDTPTPPTVRVIVGREDLLPRRIDRTRSTGGKATTRTLVLQSIAKDGDADGAQFALEVPEGYRIRAGDAAKPPRGPRAKDPADAEKPDAPSLEGVTWPHDAKLLARGDKAPAFRLEDSTGAWKRLSDYKGKIVVLDFWATWCGPCVTAIPALERVHQKYQGKNIVVLGMNCEGDPTAGAKRAGVAQFKQDKGGHYATLLNADGVSDRYKVRGIPTFYVLDAEGKVLWGGVGLAGPPGNQSPSTEDRRDYLAQTISAVIDAELKKMSEK